MRTSLALAALGVIVLHTRAAHAMGSYTNLAVEAWNADGSAVLLTRTSSSSGTVGHSTVYVLVDAASATPATFTFDDTIDLDTATQHVDLRACTRAADQLSAALRAHHFQGVTVAKAGCKTTARKVVIIAAAAAERAALSYVAPAHAHAATARELAAAAAVKSEGLDAADADVAAVSDALLVVLHGENGDDSMPRDGAAYVGGKRLVDAL